MNEISFKLVDKIERDHALSLDEYELLVKSLTPSLASYIAKKAIKARKRIYGDRVFIRGLIEISNICKNDCYYCGIRRSNKNARRYRLSKEDIISCCGEGYKLGFRTFVLQGGEDMYYTDSVLCDIVSAIKSAHPDCAVTLSMGERSRQSYKALYDSGADRYLLRHESADKEHYALLHPHEMSYDNRFRCLYDLREIGYQVGCGFMVGSPYQTPAHIASDLKFIESFKPDMCGIGPFIPHHDTPFAAMSAGTLELTCFLLSVIRLIYPNVLLPSTTALGTIDKSGREKGILSGANVVMPNLSPPSVRKKYELYDNKICTGEEAASGIEQLKDKIKLIGYKIVTERGDIIKK